MPRSDDRAYHHGDARNALLKAAERLLERGEVGALSLRGIAEAAGLSRQAPYNHFRDKAALLAELVRLGFETFTGELVAATADVSDPQDELAILAKGYHEFSRRRPVLFRLMFNRDLIDPTDHPAAIASAEACHSVLRAVVAKLQPAPDVEALTTAAWSLVHGYATLAPLRREEHDPSRLFAALIARYRERN